MKASELENIFSSITLLSYLTILLTPFLLNKFLKKVSKYYISLLLVSIILTFMISTLSTYWSEDLADQLMYKTYGFDDSGMNDEERFRNVNLGDRETIEKIYNGSFGIGWPLKLIMMFTIFMIPYNIIACGIIFMLNRKKHIS